MDVSPKRIQLKKSVIWIEEGDVIRCVNTTSERVQLDKSVIWIDNDNIIRCIYRSNAMVDYEDVLQETIVARALAGGQRSPALKDIRRVNSISVEAREHLSSRETTERTYCAVALIVASPVSKVIGNFFIGLNKPAHPVRLFPDESTGLEWLKEHLR